jgi:hypothetical protein
MSWWPLRHARVRRGDSRSGWIVPFTDTECAISRMIAAEQGKRRHRASLSDATRPNRRVDDLDEFADRSERPPRPASVEGDGVMPVRSGIARAVGAVAPPGWPRLMVASDLASS